MLIMLAPMMTLMLSVFLMIMSIILMMWNFTMIIEWEIMLMMSKSLKMELILEPMGTMYSSIVMFISSNVLKFSKNYMQADMNKLRFTYMVILFILSMTLLIFIPNLMSLLIGWDGLGITSFMLIIYYNNHRSLSAGMMTMMTNRLGDLFLLMSIISTMSMGDWLIIHQNSNNKMFMLQSIGIMMAAITKSAQMPFSSWLPAAMAAPTPVSALVHSSTLVTAGIFILCRFNNLVNNMMMMQITLMVLGMMTTLMSGLSAIYENDMKKIIALSTLSQLGFMVTTISINLYTLAFFHMSCHAMFKALLFISAGNMISMSNHNQDLRMYSKQMMMSPMMSSAIIISGSSLTGIPFMTGYYSKHMIMELSLSTTMNSIIYLLFLMMMMITSLYMMRLMMFTLITPSMSLLMNMHNSSMNNNIPLFTMSVMSTILGAMIQWMMPQMIMSSMTNKTHSIMLNLVVIMTIIMTLSLSLKNFSNPSKMNKLINNITSSIMFTTLMSSKISSQMIH